MRAMVVEADPLSAFRLSDALYTAGFKVVGTARSSGEALLLAQARLPDVVILGMNLETAGAGRRLAETLEREWQVTTVVSDKDGGTLDHPECCDLASTARERYRQTRSASNT